MGGRIRNPGTGFCGPITTIKEPIPFWTAVLPPSQYHLFQPLFLTVERAKRGKHPNPIAAPISQGREKIFLLSPSALFALPPLFFVPNNKEHHLTLGEQWGREEGFDPLLACGCVSGEEEIRWKSGLLCVCVCVRKEGERNAIRFVFVFQEGDKFSMPLLSFPLLFHKSFLLGFFFLLFSLFGLLGGIYLGCWGRDRPSMEWGGGRFWAAHVAHYPTTYPSSPHAVTSHPPQRRRIHYNELSSSSPGTEIFLFVYFYHALKRCTSSVTHLCSTLFFPSGTKKKHLRILMQFLLCCSEPPFFLALG